MTADFNWNDVADDIVVSAQAAVAVYWNGNGDLVIRQAGICGIEEDHWIVIAPAHIRALAGALLREAEAGREANPDQPGTPQLAKSKDTTAAERQRRWRAKHRNGSADGVTETAADA